MQFKQSKPSFSTACDSNKSNLSSRACDQIKAILRLQHANLNKSNPSSAWDSNKPIRLFCSMQFKQKQSFFLLEHAIQIKAILRLQHANLNKSNPSSSAVIQPKQTVCFYSMRFKQKQSFFLLQHAIQTKQAVFFYSMRI